jgi:adenosylhomocysteine nucleosidase
MIAIIGNSEDDILYFKSRMSIQETVTLAGTFKVYRGTLSREEAVISCSGESNYLSLLLTGLLLQKYQPYLVFNVGMLYSFSSQLRQGDIFIAERYYFSDVDFSSLRGTHFGQLPNLPPFFVADSSLNEQAEHDSYRTSDRYVQRGYLLSGNRFVDTQGPLETLVAERYLSEAGLMAYDTTSAGIALACYLSQVSLLTIKAVCWRIGKEDERLSRVRKGLEAAPAIGGVIARILMEKER